MPVLGAVCDFKKHGTLVELPDELLDGKAERRGASLGLFCDRQDTAWAVSSPFFSRCGLGRS
jgi:hypothetical protein